MYKQQKAGLRMLGLCVLASLLWGSPVLFAQEQNVDPLEAWNRKVDVFNQFGDKWVIKPVATVYNTVVPQPLDDGITNVFHNAREPITIVNDLFQLKFKQAGRDTGRLLINSTLGVLGVFDVAASIGIGRHVEDFGQTLGYWGVPTGPYIVLPFLGPSNIRDGLGLLPDIALNPATYIDYDPTRFSVIGGYYLDIRSNLLESEGLITGDAYVFVRDAYLQNREYLVTDGEVVDDFGDEDF